MKVLLKRFHLNGNIIGFQPQTQKLELHAKSIVPCENLLKRFPLNGYTRGFHIQTQKLELNAKQIVPCESIAEEVSVELSRHDVSSRDSKVKTGVPNDNFWKLSVRKTI